jgi:hypothetical protein
MIRLPKSDIKTNYSLKAIPIAFSVALAVINKLYFTPVAIF